MRVGGTAGGEGRAAWFGTELSVVTASTVHLTLSKHHRRLEGLSDLSREQIQELASTHTTMLTLALNLANLLYVLHDLSVLVKLKVVDLSRVLVQVVEERRIVVVEREIFTTHFVRECVGTQATV